MKNIQRKYNNSIEFVLSKIPRLNKYEIGDIFTELQDNKVRISLPFDIDEKELVLSKNEFIEQVEEYRNYEINDIKSRIISKTVRYYPCYFGHKSNHRLNENVKIEIEIEKLKIGICHEKTFLFGLIALEINAYHDKYQGPFDYEHSIRIEYKNEEQILNDEKEEQLIETFKFELLSNSGITIETYEFETDWNFLEEEEEEEKIDKNQIILKPLLPYEEGIKMYLVTESIYDNEFKFLSLYKILEHYSPIALRVDILDSLAKKLDSPKSLNPDSKFLSSIIELASSFELRKRDKELIRTVLIKLLI